MSMNLRDLVFELRSRFILGTRRTAHGLCFCRLLVLFFACSSVLWGAARTPSNWVTVTDVSGAAQVNRPFTISRFFARGEIQKFAQARVNGRPADTQCDVKTRWPDGSVQHALISFIASVPRRGTIKVDFFNQITGNNQAALGRADMLAAHWDAQIEITKGNTLTANARKIIQEWSGTNTDKRVTYWLRGPICTQVILEDRTPTLAYDLGWDSAKSFHPIFVATFYPGWSGVKVEFIGENAWTTKLEDLSYSLVLKIGGLSASKLVYRKPTLTHIAETRWRKVFWSGTEPGAVNIDYNLPYMIESRVLPNFDLTKRVPASAISDDVTAFKISDQGDISGNALWEKYMPMTGGRADIGLFPSWYVRYIYTFNEQLYQVMIGNAAVSGHVPLHYRESTTGRFFDQGKTLPAFGRPLSVDARPQVFLVDRELDTDPKDGIRPVRPLPTYDWTVDLAHQGDFVFIPYLVTGDWYFLEELYFFAASNLATGDPGDCNYCRHGSWGFIPHALQTRGQAWGLRSVAHAAIAAPDGTPEKAYFTEKLNNNIAIREGEQNITDGAFYDPSPKSKWFWGRNTVGERRANPLHFLNIGDRAGPEPSELVLGGSAFAVENSDAPWQYNYNHIVFGHIEELGFPITKLRRTLALNLLHMLKDPAFNAYLAGEYELPVTLVSTHTYFQQWADVKQGYKTSYGVLPIDVRTIRTWTPDSFEGDIDHGYPRILKAAASFLPGIEDGMLKGQDAWDWVVTHVGYQNLEGHSPKWSIVPRESQAAASVSVGPK